MQQALDLIRTSLSEYFPKGEIEGFIRLIFDDLCGFSTTDLLLKRDMKLSDDMHEKIVSIVERLKSNEPIQYILGHAYWGDFSLSVGPGVLIPRPETAEIVRRIIAEVGDVDGRVADICTGSGCIAIALSRAWRNAAVEGWDFSQKALAYARRNAVEHQAKVEWIEQDVLSYRPSQEPKYKVMVSNPPYVLESEKREMDENVLCYEPHDALFVSDDDPLLFYRAIAHIAQCELLSGGFLYFEINSKMSKECCELLQSMGFVSVQAFEDYRGMYRMVRAIKK
jgi:release factor glutamine methyltransferase